MEKFIVIKLPLIKSDSFYYADFDKNEFQIKNEIILDEEISKSVTENELIMIFKGRHQPKKRNILDSF